MELSGEYYLRVPDVIPGMPLMLLMSKVGSILQLWKQGWENAGMWQSYSFACHGECSRPARTRSQSPKPTSSFSLVNETPLSPLRATPSDRVCSVAFSHTWLQSCTRMPSTSTTSRHLRPYMSNRKLSNSTYPTIPSPFTQDSQQSPVHSNCIHAQMSRWTISSPNLPVQIKIVPTLYVPPLSNQREFLQTQVNSCLCC